MFENRVPHMLDNDYTPHSAVDIFVKDLVRMAVVSVTEVYMLAFIECSFCSFQGIVAKECSMHKVPLHVATAAHQLFLQGNAIMVTNSSQFCVSWCFIILKFRAH